MKYWQLFKKYILLFGGAVLFGLAAVKLSSANKREREATDEVRRLTVDAIEIRNAEIDASVSSMNKRQDKNREAKANAIKKLDKLSDGSGSVKSLLNDYERDRVQFNASGNSV